jgi:nucleotide-binding universal stress UspA family protein
MAFAEENQPDLIVMGARGLRSTLGILLGGVAQNVVEYASCPVLIVRAPYEGLRRVLLATDGSDNSQYALQYLENCPLPADVRKFVMHVLPPEITSDMFSLSWQTSPDLRLPILTEQMQEQMLRNSEEEERKGQSLLEKTSMKLEKLGYPAISVLRRGDAATEIINYAKEEKIDLIIVGSRGLSTFRSWLLGSVSRKLVHYADCSVLIVKKS